MRGVRLIISMLLIIPAVFFAQGTLPNQSDGELQLLSAKNSIEEDLLSVHLDLAKIEEVLTKIPKQLKFNTKASPYVINLPLSETWTESFLVSRLPIKADEFENSYPEIQTFQIISQEDDKIQGSLTYYPGGIYATILNHGNIISVRPDFGSNSKTLHIIEKGFGSENSEGLTCGLTESDFDRPNKNIQAYDNRITERNNGETRRVYTMAIVTTGEFYQANGNNNTDVVASITAGVAGLQALYNKELSVIPSILTPFLYTNPDTDPFTPDEMGGDPRPEQAATAVHMHFNQNLYDIGHVLHTTSADDGWSGGGVALLQSVCSNFNFSGGLRKGAGWSGSSFNAGNGWLQLFAHEVAHMFGAQHTFNGTGENCTDAISSNNAYEIGSGSTIMSYQGICEAGQNISSSGEADNYFHVTSLIEMLDYILSQTCETVFATQNTPPEVNANPCDLNITIPRNTPFFIEGSASDADGENLDYCWEQYDEDGDGTPTQGFIGTAASASTIAPLFRSYPPNNSPRRYFPNKQSVLNLVNDPFEVLSNVSRDINFKLTVRDNNLSGGGIAIDHLNVQVGPGGPFFISYPNGGNNINTGEEFEIRWETSGSDPYCNMVNVELSIDGGQSFPFVLAEDIDYSAEAVTVIIPASLPNSDQARIKISCADNPCIQFYDVSNLNFNLISTCFPENNFICPTNPLVVNRGDPQLDLSINHYLGDAVDDYMILITNFLPLMPIAINSPDGPVCQSMLFTRYDSIVVTATATGTYRFDIDFNQQNFGVISIFDADNFDNNLPCLSFIGSSGSFTNDGFISTGGFVEVELEVCHSYVILFYNFTRPSFTILESVSGPGEIVEENPNPNPDFSYTFLAINIDSGVITFVDDNADFTSLPGGNYEIYGASYKASGDTPPENIDPNDWIGQTVIEVISNGSCFMLSQKAKPVTVNTVCEILSVELGNQTPCDPINNLYSQEIIISYDQAPDDTEIVVNGTNYALDSNPQNINLENLVADGNGYNVEIHFTKEIGCSFVRSNLFIAPENCCPIELEFGSDIIECSDTEVILDAGVDGQTYVWLQDDMEIMGQVESTLKIESSGNYAVIVSDVNGCQKTDEIEVQINPITSIDIGDDMMVCADEMISLEAVTSAQTVNWYLNSVLIDGQNTTSLVINESGEYRGQVINEFDCITEDTAIVIVNPIPETSLGEDQMLCGGDAFTLDAGPEGLLYNWYKDGKLLVTELGQTIQVEESGIYKVELINEFECNAQDEVEIQFFALPEAEIGTDQILCTGEVIPINAIFSGQSYEWYKDGVLLMNPNGLNLNITEGGFYIFIAYNEIFCAVSDTISIFETSPPQVELGPDQILCEGEFTLLDAGNDGSEYIWQKDGIWLSSETNSQFSPTESGQYTVEIINDFGCSAFDTVNYEIFALPIAEIGTNETFCFNESVVIEAEFEGVNYDWYKDGILFTNPGGLSLEIVEEGQYIFIAYNELACSVSDTLDVIENLAPDVELGPDQMICEGETVILMAGDEGVSYTWYKDGALIANESESSLSVIESAEYTVGVTNQQGCTTEDMILVEFFELPSITLEGENQLCLGDTILITANFSGDRYQWYLDGIAFENPNGLLLKVTSGGTFGFSAFNEINCEVSDELIVEAFAKPVANLGADQEACKGEVLLLNSGSIGNIYRWYKNTQLMPNTSASIEVSENGSYTVEVFNNDGCMSLDEVEVEFFALPGITLEGENRLCLGDTITVIANFSGDSYQWYLDGIPFDNPDGLTIELNSGGTYSFSAFNEINCEVSEELIVEAFSKPVANLGVDLIACEGDEIQLFAGSSGNFYQWYLDGILLPDMTENIQIEQSGTYLVEVTNSDGCMKSDEAEVEIFALPSIALDGENRLCLGETLTINANFSGDSYQWYLDGMPFDNPNGLILEVTTGGVYSFTALNEIGCEVTDELIIAAFTKPLADLGADLEACEGDQIKLFAGSSGNSYQWYLDGVLLPDLTENIQATESGTYQVEVTSSDGCMSADETIVEIFELPFVQIGDDMDVCIGEQVSIEAQVIGQNYQWFYNGIEIQSSHGLIHLTGEPGTYVIAGFNEIGCEVRDTMQLHGINPPAVNLGDDKLGCLGSTIILDAGIQNLSYQWYFNGGIIQGEEQQTIEISEGGNYEVQVSDGFGCQTIDEVMVDFVPAPTLELGADQMFCDGDSYTINAETNANEIVWILSDDQVIAENVFSLEVSLSGVYTVVVSGDSGCSVEKDIIIEVLSNPTVELGNDQKICELESTLLNAGNEGVSYNWTLNGQSIGTNSSTLEANQTGTYEVLVTNADNCQTSDNLFLEVSPLPSLSIDNMAELCEGEFILLEATSNAQVFEWYRDDILLTGETNHSININQGGEYQLVAISFDQCRQSAEVLVFERPLPGINLGDDLQLCPNESINLSAGNHETYEWSSGESTPTIMVHSPNPMISQTENYSVIVTNMFGCENSDEIQVEFFPIVSANIQADNTGICQGESIMLQASGGLYYTWNDPNGSLSAIDISNPVASPTKSTSYSVIVSDNCPNNSDVAQFELKVFEMADIRIISDTCMVRGRPIELFADGGSFYSWDPAEFIIGSNNVKDPTIEIQADTKFTVLIADINGCEYLEEVNVCYIDDPLSIFQAVSIITPNGDGDNDFLEFKGLEAFPDNEIIIFNRWGNVVYDRKGYQLAGEVWDGTKNGELLPAGVYYYILRFADFDIKSSLTIIYE